MMKRVLILSALLAAGVAAQGQAAPVIPEVTAVACRQPVQVDGRLTEECWQRAQPMTNFHLLGKHGQTTDSTVAKVAYDHAWLYVGITCAHPALYAVKPQHLQHDSAVTDDESVEVFIDPGGNGNPYFHFKLNCANVKAEQRCTAAGLRDTHWDCPWLSAVTLGKQGWTAEIAIPLYVLASYGDLSRARINVTRNMLVPNIDRQAAVLGWSRVLSSWAPVVRSFHEPDLFGRLRGLTVTGLQTPFLALFDNVQIGGYQLAGARYCYPVTMEVRGYNDRPGQVKVAVTDDPVTGQGRTVAQTVKVQGATPQSLKFMVPVDAPVQRDLTVTMTDGDTPAVFNTTRVPGGAALQLASAYLDRTYYTTESQAGLMCSLGMPDSMLRGTELSVTNARGKVLVRQPCSSAQVRVGVPLAGFPLGANKITLRWQRADGALIFSQDLNLIKLAPRPGGEWNVDRVNGVILHDGKPFFVAGMLMSGINSDDEADIKRVAAAGFNTLAYWSYARDPAEVGAYMQVAAKYGLKVLGRLEACNKRGVAKSILAKFFSGPALARVVKACRSCSATNLKGLLVANPDLSALPRKAKTEIFTQYYQGTLQPMLDSVRIASQHDNCIGFNSFDEPCLTVFDQDVAGRDLYRRVHQVDGYHPVFLLYSSYIPDGENAVDWCDALGTDPYWVPAGANTRNTPNFVSKITWMTHQRARAAHEATWIVPMAEFWSGVHKRAILPPEQFCQTYLALIHGAKSLLYFRYPIMHQETWDTLSAVAKQLQVLGPIAVTPDLPQQITYDPGKFDALTDQYPDVQVSLRRNPAGGTVLLAANSRPYPVDVTYTLSCLGAQGQVARLFATDHYPVHQGAFTDHLAAYDTRAYALTMLPTGAAPVRIKVSVKAHPPVGWKPELEIPRSGRPGKRNLLPNPSFEQASLPGWPDYYRPWYSQPLIGNKDAGWGQDTQNPYEGKYCLRITKNQPAYNGFYFYISPQFVRPTTCVFSLYMRGERDGMNVSLGGGGLPWKRVTLTTSWQRYFVSGTMPARAGRNNMIEVRLASDGRIWADAVQFEKGEEPTAFQP